MDGPRRRQLVVLGIALLGLALMLNPLYLYPDGGGAPERTYHVSQIENETMAQQALQLSDDVLDCPGDRPCALERQVLDEGALETEVYVDDDWRWYPVVLADNGAYVPHERHGENGTVLTLEAVDIMEAVERAAVPAEERPEEVDEAVESGSVTVHGDPVESFERYEILERDGEYYYHHRLQASGGHWTDGFDLPLVRAVFLLLGGGLVAYAGWSLRGIAEET